ncbi:MAG: hypothetical protein F4Y03_05480 [Alphaproteobacteria bacterium]|nr:hypothetical protein [Alphaproteobacteria bacterium]
MTFKRGEIKAALTSKGFNAFSGSNHEKFIYFRLSGLKTHVFTLMSYGRSGMDIATRRVGDMARQCRIDRETFTGLISCDIDQEEYEAVLIQQKDLLEAPPD